MACHSCGGAEFFTQSSPDFQTKQEMPVPKAPGCPSKEMMSSCLYTAQGVFICNKASEQSSKGVAKNVDMAQESVRTGNKFNNAGLWNVEAESKVLLKLYP